MYRSDVLANFEGLEALLAKSVGPDGVCLPSASQSVVRAYDLAIETMRNFPDRPVVLVGCDALSYAFWRRHAPTSDRFTIHPVTSVMPSTSACCWTSVLTGKFPQDHGVHGVVFYEKPVGKTVHALRPVSFDLSLGIIKDAPPALNLVDQDDLIFARARALGRHTYTIGRLAFDTKGPLHRQLCTQHNFVPDDYETLIQQPIALVDRLFHQLEQRLGQAESFGFLYLNFDTYLHENSYADTTLVEATAAAWENCIRLADTMGAVFVFVSDHGMIEQNATGRICPIDNTALLDLSYASPGGAGRVLYYYVAPPNRKVAIEKLYDLLGDTAIVLDRDAYIAKFLTDDTNSVSHIDRIGDVVAVARTPEFPSVMSSSLNEHGAASVDEMITTMGLLYPS